MKGLGKRISSYRKLHLLSQEELAGIVGVSSGAVSKWEREISVPDIEVLVRLADYFEISMDKLLGRNTLENGEISFYNQREADRYYLALELLECCRLAREEGLLVVGEYINANENESNPFLKFAVNYMLQGVERRMTPMQAGEYLVMYAEGEPDAFAAKTVCKVLGLIFSGEPDRVVKEWLRAFLGRKYSHLIAEDESEAHWKMSREDAIIYYSGEKIGMEDTGLLAGLETCEDKTVQLLLREVENEDVVYGMLGASDSVRRKIFENLSDRMIILLGEDMCRETYDSEKIVTAQKKLCKIWKRLVSDK